MNFKGKVALVTGSGRNIGRAMVLELASKGATVIVNAKSNNVEAEKVASEATALGVQAKALIADVGIESQVKDMVDTVIESFGKIDILVNNAGARNSRAFTELTVAEWRSAIATNLDGPFYCCKAVVPHMIANGGGRIVNISGLNAFMGSPNWAHICASKMGAIGLTRSLASELAPFNILVNHIVPGAFDTDLENSEEARRKSLRVSNIPAGRLGLPIEVAKLCTFLASTEADFITGQAIHINGGEISF